MASSCIRCLCFKLFGCCKEEKVNGQKTVEAGEEVTESKTPEIQEVLTVTSQPTVQEVPPTVSSICELEDTNFRDPKEEGSALRQNNNTVLNIEKEPIKFEADIEYLTNSLSNSEELISSLSSPVERVAPSRDSCSRPQSIHIEQDTVYLAPAEEKVKLLQALNLKLSHMMETVDTLVMEQPGSAKTLEEEPSLETPEALSSLIDQSEAARETTPENDTGSGSGSMHTSTGSEGLEEDEKEKMVNGDKQPEEDVVVLKKSEQKSNKEGHKEEKSSKSKKKEDKTIDHILRALSSLHTTEEKLAALCKKYADLHEEHRTVQSTFKQTQRKLTVVTREKDQLQTEHTKAVMAKSRLEGLCRELQKHNQLVKQESFQRAKEDEEKRKEISNKFQTTISEIQQQMSEHHERNIKLREENQELAGKLKKFIEQYEVREKQVEKLMQHRELEQKLADAKLQQASAILTEEQERNKKEREMLLLQAAEGQKRATLLEAQLGMYKERYEEFQTTISKSNDMFQKFKTEMDKMTKRIKKLEKDGAAWKNKWENANKALLQMAEEKTLYDKEKPVLMNKIQKLESLCRAMQAERLGRKVMEASNIDVPKLGCDSSDTEVSTHSDATNHDQEQNNADNATTDPPHSHSCDCEDDQSEESKEPPIQQPESTDQSDQSTQNEAEEDETPSNDKEKTSET